MKVKLLRRAWKNLRLIQAENKDYIVQSYEQDYGWTGLRRGTLKDMLSYRRDLIRKYIRTHPELIEDRITVLC